MDMNDYQEKAKTTALYPKVGATFVYPVLGLAGEAGEIANKVKKVFRDDAGVLTETKRSELEKELGDVLWYVAQVATELGLSLDAVATLNIERLASRKERGTLHGDGDNR